MGFWSVFKYTGSHNMLFCRQPSITHSIRTLTCTGTTCLTDQNCPCFPQLPVLPNLMHWKKVVHVTIRETKRSLSKKIFFSHTTTSLIPPKAVSSSLSKTDGCLRLPPLQVDRKKIAGKEKNLKAILILANIQPRNKGQKLHLTASRIQDHKDSRLHYFSWRQKEKKSKTEFSITTQLYYLKKEHELILLFISTIH